MIGPKFRATNFLTGKLRQFSTSSYFADANANSLGAGIPNLYSLWMVRKRTLLRADLQFFDLHG